MPCLTGGQLNCFFANMTSCFGISTLIVEGEGVGKTVAPITKLLPEVVKLTGPSVGEVQLPNNVGDGVEGLRYCVSPFEKLTIISFSGRRRKTGGRQHFIPSHPLTYRKRVPLQSVIVLRPISVFIYSPWPIQSYTGIIEIIVEVTEAVVVGCNIVLHKLDIPGISTNPEKHGHSQSSSARTLAAVERSRKVGDNFIFNRLQRIMYAKLPNLGCKAEDDDQHSSAYNLYIYGRPLRITASWESYAEL